MDKLKSRLTNAFLNEPSKVIALIAELAEDSKVRAKIEARLK